METVDYIHRAVHPLVRTALVCPFDHPDGVAHNPDIIDCQVSHEACDIGARRDEADASRKQIVGDELHDRSAIGRGYGP